jgi:hypothetical protein
MADNVTLIFLASFIVFVTALVRNPWVLRALHEYGNHYNSAYLDDNDEDISEDLGNYSYLIGLVYYDDDMKMSYVTTRLHVDSSKNIVAYRKRVVNYIEEGDEKDGAVNVIVVEKMLGFYGESRSRTLYKVSGDKSKKML